jgi:hypothetical protein
LGSKIAAFKFGYHQLVLIRAAQNSRQPEIEVQALIVKRKPFAFCCVKGFDENYSLAGFQGLNNEK